MNNSDYAEYIAEVVSKSLKYSEYVADILMSETSLSYSEYIATHLDPQYEIKKLRKLRKIKIEKILNERED